MYPPASNDSFGLNKITLDFFQTEYNHSQSSRALGWNTNDPTVFDYGWDLLCGNLSAKTYLVSFILYIFFFELSNLLKQFKSTWDSVDHNSVETLSTKSSPSSTPTESIQTLPTLKLNRLGRISTVLSVTSLILNTDLEKKSK